jgi:hypothetical protein
VKVSVLDDLSEGRKRHGAMAIEVGFYLRCAQFAHVCFVAVDAAAGFVEAEDGCAGGEAGAEFVEDFVGGAEDEDGCD